MTFAKPPIVEDSLRQKYQDLGYWSRPPLALHVEEHASKHPSNLAVTDGSGNELTYREFNNAVIAATSWFKSNGLLAGDSVVFALRNEIAVKQSWIKNSAHLSSAAPWLLLLLLAMQPSTVQAFSTITGAGILFIGLFMTVLAYIWMTFLSRLPSVPRVFGGDR